MPRAIDELLTGEKEAIIHPAATVVLIRDVKKGIEVLLLRRSSKLKFVGGAWVFPGGKIDKKDFPEENSSDTETAALNAAVRETQEEAGLVIRPDDLIYFSHWTTPPESPKRYDTWFFISGVDSGNVVVDGSEMKEHGWFNPEEVLIAQKKEEIELMPPTIVTISDLSRFSSVKASLDYYRKKPPSRFLPHVLSVPGGVALLYPGDAGYEDKELDVPGPRNRFWVVESGWQYEKKE
jgi:8-oxo-dGTP pyrophosphatase MutT (NUDIX family)